MVAVATKRFDAVAVGAYNAWSDEAGGAVAAADITSRSSPAFSGAYIDSNSAADVRQSFTIDTGFVEKMAFVLDVRVVGLHRSNSGTSLSQKFFVRINATDVDGSAFNSTTTPTERAESISRPGGGDWTEADFRLTGGNAFNFGVFHPSQTPQDCEIDELYVDVDYIPLGRTIDHEREVASRKLLLEGEPEPLISVIGGWDHAAAELMATAAIAHSGGPNFDQSGWGYKVWQRAFGRYKAQTIDLIEPKVRSTVGDRRRYQVTYWERMAAVISSDPDVADGLPRLDTSGAEREFSRSSKAWVEDVGGEIIAINEAKEKIEPKGTLIEGERTNLALQSSFVNGTTGYTKTENSGSATFAQETDVDFRLFSTDVSPGSVSVVTSVGTNDIDIDSPASASLASSTTYTISVDWNPGLSGTKVLRIQNDTTGNWLQSDGSWSASEDDVITAPASLDSVRQHLTFTTEGTASTHTIRTNIADTGGSTLIIQHFQIEAGTYPTSRIVTEASSITREVDSLVIDNSSSLAQRIWPVDKFTAKVVFRPWWNQSDLAANKTVLELYHNNSNLIRITATTSNALNFNYIHGGTTETAQYPTSALAEDTEYAVVIRRCSDQLEHGNADGQLTIFIDGVKGSTEDSTGTDLTEQAAGVLNLGMVNGGSNILDGWLKEIKVSPVVFSDEEIAAGL